MAAIFVLKTKIVIHFHYKYRKKKFMISKIISNFIRKKQTKMTEKDKELSVLMPPPKMEGGLIRMPKKSNPETENHLFKTPAPIGMLNFNLEKFFQNIS